MDYFEIDLLDVESDKSGDAITLRYRVNGSVMIHVVDGGFQLTGESVVNHIRNYYANPPYADHVVSTHSDSDHAGGLRAVLDTCSVGRLWLLRPWLYADALLPHFERVTSRDYLVRVLKDAYPNIAALEAIAQRRGIPISEPLQGAHIGAFTVLAPSLPRYLHLVLRSDCTPDSTAKTRLGSIFEAGRVAVGYAGMLIKAAWGQETFSPQGVSAENEMSVVQSAIIAGQKIMLTADAGREALAEAIAFAPQAPFLLPGIDRFQVPHHGSRRNLTSELLDSLLGQRLAGPLAPGQEAFTAVISSAKKDEKHPRKSVVRAMHHRGGLVVATEGVTTCSSNANAPNRGWTAAPRIPYPLEEESD
jgi:hypothetical protein